MTTKCEHCKGTRVEPGEANCTWCDNTGGKNGLSAEVKVDLKPFRLLPYGGKFRYQGTTDVWVRTGHNLVAEWPSRVSAADGTPIQSLCCFCHLDEDGDTLDTMVELVDHEFERDAALAAEQIAIGAIAHNQLVIKELQQRLTAADEREDALGSLVPEAELALKALNVAASVYDVELADSARRGLRLIIAALKPAECCTVSAEDRTLLEAGDYTPEELFGVGGKPSCPKCFKPAEGKPDE